jgi:hypothetical protein
VVEADVGLDEELGEDPARTLGEEAVEAFVPEGDCHCSRSFSVVQERDGDLRLISFLTIIIIITLICRIKVIFKLIKYMSKY